jgi:hypothetical protein
MQQALPVQQALLVVNRAGWGTVNAENHPFKLLVGMHGSFIVSR